MNFNSHRKVAISSSSQTRSREQIIQDARQKRLERQQQQQKTDAAKKILKLLRAIRARNQWKMAMQREIERDIDAASGWEAYRRILGAFWLMRDGFSHEVFHAYLWKFFIHWVQQGGVKIATSQDLHAMVWLFGYVAGYLCQHHDQMTEKDEQLYYRVLIKSLEKQWFASVQLHSDFVARCASAVLGLFSIVQANAVAEDRMSDSNTGIKSVTALKMIAFLWSKLFSALGEAPQNFNTTNLSSAAATFCNLLVYKGSLQTTLAHETAFSQFINTALSNITFVASCFAVIAQHEAKSDATLTIAANVKFMLKTHIIKSGITNNDSINTLSLLESYVRALNTHLPSDLETALTAHDRIHQDANVTREIRTSTSPSHFALLTQLMEVVSSKGDPRVLAQCPTPTLISLSSHLCTMHHKLIAIARSPDFASVFAYTHKLWMEVFWYCLKKSVAQWSENPTGEYSTILSTFSSSYNEHLEQLSDDEFLSNQGALTVQEATKLAYVMKHLIFALYTGSATDHKHLRRKIQRMLHILYDIDMRRRWAPENHWILPVAERIEFTHLEGANMSFGEEDEEEPSASDMMDVSDDSTAQPERIRLQRSAQKTRTLSKDVLWNILNHIPFILSFEKRLGIFTHFLHQEHVNLARRFMRPVTIRRDRIFDDAFTKLSHLNLKHTLNIQFESNGEVEEGIGAGVQKEFLTLLAADAFSIQYGLFVETPQRGMIYPNPHYDIAADDPLEKYEFLGQVLASCIYFRILVDVPVTGFFLKQILGKKNTINDLYEYDPQLFRNLMYIKQHDVTDMGLTFTVGDEVFGEQREVELITNGASIPVTNENKEKYIAEVANFRLNKQIKAQSRAFSRGMRLVMNEKWLDLFSERELRMLISGGNAPISVEDWKKNSIYGNVRANDQLIEWFWDIVNNDLGDEDRRKLLKFVTASTSPPIEGFQALEPKFAISVDIYADPERLPSSSTCVNLCKMPRYRSRAQLKEKLLKAIREVDTFELT